MKKSFFVILVWGISQFTLCQNVSEADVLFNNNQFIKAKSIYATLLKRKPADMLLNYKYARCCFELKEYDLAITHFEQSGSKFAQKNAYLAEAYFQNYQFELSVSAAKSYISGLEPTDKDVEQFEKLIKKAELGSKLLNRVEDISIIDSITVNKNDFLKSITFNAELGSLTQQRIRVGKLIQDKITFQTQRADRSCFSDSTKGNMDIFSSYKLLDEWTLPTSVSKTINTKANENYPFLLQDGITLYFASDGENSLGGYDIFVTKYTSASKDYLSPENIGFPYNSTANDYMMVIDEHQKTGWFATDRNQASGKVALYAFNYSEPKKYFKSDDTIQVINTALLKTYKRAKNKLSGGINVRLTETASQTKSQKIIINDSTLYNTIDDFKLPEAKLLYSESAKIAIQLEDAEKKLNQLRTDYENATDEDKLKIKSEIIYLENSVLNLKQESINKHKNAINMEINFISGN